MVRIVIIFVFCFTIVYQVIALVQNMIIQISVIYLAGLFLSGVKMLKSHSLYQ